MGAAYWRHLAEDNVEEWGQQDLQTLLLAATEELGELVRAHLEHEHEDGDLDEIQAELDDLAALCYQIQWAIHRVQRQEVGV